MELGLIKDDDRPTGIGGGSAILIVIRKVIGPNLCLAAINLQFPINNCCNFPPFLFPKYLYDILFVPIINLKCL